MGGGGKTWENSMGLLRSIFNMAILIAFLCPVTAAHSSEIVLNSAEQVEAFYRARDNQGAFADPANSDYL